VIKFKAEWIYITKK